LGLKYSKNKKENKLIFGGNAKFWACSYVEVVRVHVHGCSFVCVFPPPSLHAIKRRDHVP